MKHNDDILMNYTFYGKLAATLIENGAHTATYYIDPRLTLRATRKRTKYTRKTDPIEIVFKYGRPNYEARHFIKDCKRAGESFPVKKIQLKFPAKKKNKK